jgi:hypothetical protein
MGSWVLINGHWYKAWNSLDKLRPLWGPDRRRSGPHLFADSGCKFSFVLPFWGGVLVRLWRTFGAAGTDKQT